MLKTSTPGRSFVVWVLGVNQVSKTYSQLTIRLTKWVCASKASTQTHDDLKSSLLHMSSHDLEQSFDINVPTATSTEVTQNESQSSASRDMSAMKGPEQAGDTVKQVTAA